jgi:hypothetical protein
VLERSHREAGLDVVEETPQWTIYSVENARPIFRPVYGSAYTKVITFSATSYFLWAGEPGLYTLSARYTPYWRVDDPTAACVTKGSDGFVQLRVMKPGPIKVSFDVSAGTAASAVAGGSSYCLQPPAAPAS